LLDAKTHYLYNEFFIINKYNTLYNIKICKNLKGVYIMITVSLQEKNGIYQAVLNYKDDTGKRKQKWKSTGITIKNNKKLALIKAIEFRLEFEKKT